VNSSKIINTDALAQTVVVNARTSVTSTNTVRDLTF